MNAALRCLAVLSMVLSCSFARAQGISSSAVSVDAEVFPPRILPGSSGKLILTLVMAPGWHVNSNDSQGENLYPTEFSWKPPAGLTVTQVQYPKGIPVRVSFQDEPVMVYQDEVQIVVDFRVESTVRPGPVPLAGEITVQACSDEVCLAPSELPVNASVEILRPIRPKRKSAP
jgi:thiol:disulfide interchange protein DsbD